MQATVTTIKPATKTVEYQIDNAGDIVSHGHQVTYTDELTLAELDALATADAVTAGHLPGE